MTNQRCSLTICLLALALASPAFADDNARGKNKSKEGTVPEEQAPAKPDAISNAALPGVKGVISSSERDTIRNYIESHNVPSRPGKKVRPLPPGLVKKTAPDGDLPPGWTAKCVPGMIMSKEMYRYCHRLPQELVWKLPPAPAGTILVCLDGQVVRLVKATREILDVFEVG
jgi:hypothetical protein